MEKYTDDYAVIEQDLTEAQALEFNEYCGFLAHYGVKLRELAAKHDYPEGAFEHLRGYADALLDRLNE
ncbi:hypothetical protein ACFU9Y_04070 [Streptomyces sp. NPDC057621]|uniref:hypothetical protein n=1 Tax=Streptomyces sp. NPDC057621 TaxID=3346186 RepID=UPI003681D4E5